MKKRPAMDIVKRNKDRELLNLVAPSREHVAEVMAEVADALDAEAEDLGSLGTPYVHYPRPA